VGDVVLNLLIEKEQFFSYPNLKPCILTGVGSLFATQTWVGSLFTTQKASTWRAGKYLLAN